MNNEQFIDIVSEKTNIKPGVVTQVFKNLNSIITDSVNKGNKVKIADFGVFSKLDLKSREIVDPRNVDKKITIPATSTVRFQSSENFRRETSKNIDAKSTDIETAQALTPSLGEPVVARSVFVPYVNLSEKKIDKKTLDYIPEQMARKYQIAPVEIKDNKLILAMIDPEDQEALEFAKKKTGLAIEPRICTKEDLNTVLDQYSVLTSEVAKIIKSEEEVEVKKEKKEKTPKSEEIAEGAPAAKIVSSLIKKAVRERASDIHIEPEEDDMIVRLRIDGVLKKVLVLPKEIQNAVVSRIKILSNLKIDETRLPQDGRFRIIIDQGEIDFRVSVLPNINGEKVVLRILDKSKGLLTLEELGLRGNAYKTMEENIKKAHGMILVTGPTGSGKTTTLYAMIQKIMNEGINIVTLEDPVEYRIKGISQSHVRADIGFNFANGLRSIVRQDPDVIMIGEIRDYETADMAIHASLTGHVVLSTLHTNDASGAIPRMIDMKVEPFLIASTVNLIIAQRLARKICDKCREPMELPVEEINFIKDILAGNKEYDGRKLVFQHGKGCENCSGTGYKGRLGIFEVLNVDKKIKEIISQKTSSEVILENAIKLGMTTLKQDGILKALDGLTTIDEVWRVTKD